MKLSDLMDLTLKEVLENYVAVCNLECCYYYGIARAEDIDELYEKYDIDEYPEAFIVESVMNDELLLEDDLVDMDKLERIMDNLGIMEK